MNEEYLDILDEDGEKTGQSKTYKETHERGLIHAAVHVWIINDEGKILIQKREKNRRFYPSHWDISAAGHVSTGQTSREAAVRETKEELGIDVNESDLKLIGTLRTESEFPEFGMVNREFNDVYIVQMPLNKNDISLNDGEVEDVKFLGLAEFKKWVNGGGEKMAPHQEEYNKVIEYIENGRN